MLLTKKNRNKTKLVLALSNIEYTEFLNKLRGCLIFRGKGACSYRRVDKLLWDIKKKKYQDPIKKLWEIFNNLLPLFSISYKKKGKRRYPVPSIAYGNKRFVIMLDWILRRQKGKTNIRGVNMKEITHKLISVLDKKGQFMAVKREFYKTALSGRHFLLKRKKSSLKIKRKILIKKPKKIKIEEESKKAPEINVARYKTLFLNNE